MQQVETINEMRHVVADARTKGQSIALVPTMGALHEGHLTLVDEARRVADTVVMSVFVIGNPLRAAESYRQGGLRQLLTGGCDKLCGDADKLPRLVLRNNVYLVTHRPASQFPGSG